MSSEDVLPTYEEAMKIHQTPWHIIEEEAINLTFNEPSTTSKIKSIISRRQSASQHGVYTGPKRKGKIVVFVENMLFGKTGLATRLILNSTLTCRFFSSSSKKVPRSAASRPGRLGQSRSAVTATPKDAVRRCRAVRYLSQVQALTASHAPLHHSRDISMVTHRPK